MVIALNYYGFRNMGRHNHYYVRTPEPNRLPHNLVRGMMLPDQPSRCMVRIPSQAIFPTLTPVYQRLWAMQLRHHEINDVYDVELWNILDHQLPTELHEIVVDCLEMMATPTFEDVTPFV